MRVKILIASLMLLAAALVLWPEEDQKLNESVQDVPAEEQAQEVATLSPEPQQESVSNQAREREEAATGHRILVLDQQGQPLANITVGFYEVDETRIENTLTRWQDVTLQPRPEHFMHASREVLTGSDGIAQLPIRGLGAAGVVHPVHGMGCVFFYEPDEGQAPGLHELQLQVRPFLEVLCLDPQDQAVADLRLHLQLAPAGRAAELQGEARDRLSHRGGIWYPSDIHAISDDEGRAWLPLVIPEQALRESDAETDWLLRVVAQVAGMQGVQAETEFPRDTPLILRVPARASLALELVGFPTGTVPMLGVQDGDQVHEIRPQDPSADSTFVFESVPVARPLQARFMTVVMDEDAGFARHWRELPIRAQEVQALQVAGEQATRRLHFEGRGLLRGQLTAPPHRQESLSWTGAVEVTAKAIPRDRDRGFDTLPIGVFADGSFLLSPPELDGATELADWSAYEALCFEWRSTEYGPSSPAPGASSRRSLYGEIEIPVAGLPVGVDLGEVALQETPLLLEVLVVDEQSNPIEGAAVNLTARTERLTGRDWHRGSAQQVTTDHTGRSWIQDFDWYSEFGFAAPDHPQSRLGEILELKLQVRVTQGFGSTEGPTYEPTTVTLTPDQQQVTIQLKRAGVVELSFVAVEGLGKVQAILVPQGMPLMDARMENALVGGVSTDMQYFDAGAICNAKMRRIGVGTWDCVLSVDPTGFRELLRIPDIVVTAEAPCRDPRLQQIDLSRLVSLFQIEVVDEQGSRLSEPEIRGDMDFIISETRSGSAYVDQVGGRWHLAAPLGSAPQLWWTDPRWRAVDLRTLRPGLNQITAEPRGMVDVTFDDDGLLPAGAAWRVHLHPAGAVTASSRVRSDAEAGSKVELTAAGKMMLVWYLRESADGEFSHPVRSTMQIDGDHLDGRKPLSLQPPAELLDLLRSKQEPDYR